MANVVFFSLPQSDRQGHSLTGSQTGQKLYPFQGHNKKNQGVFVKYYMYALSSNKVQKAIFSFKVKVKVTRSLTLMSFERVSFMEYACQI